MTSIEVCLFVYFGDRVPSTPDASRTTTSRRTDAQINFVILCAYSPDFRFSQQIERKLEMQYFLQKHSCISIWVDTSRKNRFLNPAMYLKHLMFGVFTYWKSWKILYHNSQFLALFCTYTTLSFYIFAVADDYLPYAVLSVMGSQYQIGAVA